MKTRKPQKIKLIAKNPRKIIAALKSWAAAADKVDSDPMRLNEAPPWVETALIEVAKTYMPGKWLPTEGELDMELLGECIGRMEVVGKLISGKIPMGSEMKEGMEELKKQAALLPESKERTAREKILKRDFQVRVNATNQFIPDFIKAALDSSHEDAVKFQEGLLRGMSVSADELTAGQIFERHTRTFLVLALGWRRFSKCRSIGEIHRILCKEIGVEKIGSLKTFENRVVKKIGLKVRKRGRPPGK